MNLPLLYPVQELIDTLWNVNRVVKIDLILCIKELIDTLWNVNVLLKFFIFA